MLQHKPTLSGGLCFFYCLCRPFCGRARARAGPAGQYSWRFTVAATTVFAGEPAPTRIVW
ncbi:MAG TPA: hypothetical protein DDZ74_12525 [Pseudomonas sp.]|nr:hypothetical protein [Pseudomonas sp.]